MQDGYLAITNVDISPIVIKTMKMRHLDIPHLKRILWGHHAKIFQEVLPFDNY
jgi:hypothetical protein